MFSEERKRWLEANYGIVINDDGTVNGWVITRDMECSESYKESFPREACIYESFFGSDSKEVAYVICAQLNSKNNLPYLPFYVAEAKIKIVGKEEKIVNSDLEKLGFEPLS